MQRQRYSSEGSQTGATNQRAILENATIMRKRHSKRAKGSRETVCFRVSLDTQAGSVCFENFPRNQARNHSLQSHWLRREESVEMNSRGTATVTTRAMNLRAPSYTRDSRATILATSWPALTPNTLPWAPLEGTAGNREVAPAQEPRAASMNTLANTHKSGWVSFK